MSQAGIISRTTGPVPPAVPTSFTTDYNAAFSSTGVSVPQANVENVVGGFTGIDNPNGIATQANPDGDKNLLILLTNRVRGAMTSVNGATISLITVPLGNIPACYRFQLEIVGRDLASGDGAGYTILGTVKTDGTTASQVKTPFVDEDEDDSLIPTDIALIASGNNGILSIIGIPGKNIAYVAVGTYIKV
jgi:hypothetical protein